MLSVDAVQLRLILVGVNAEAERPPGTLGAIPSSVVALADALCSDSLPMASYADTV
jgi:hypothetical protein